MVECWSFRGIPMLLLLMHLVTAHHHPPEGPGHLVQLFLMFPAKLNLISLRPYTSHLLEINSACINDILSPTTLPPCSQYFTGTRTIRPTYFSTTGLHIYHRGTHVVHFRRLHSWSSCWFSFCTEAVSLAHTFASLHRSHTSAGLLILHSVHPSQLCCSSSSRFS